jgi:hypothetical protein
MCEYMCNESILIIFLCKMGRTMSLAAPTKTKPAAISHIPQVSLDHVIARSDIDVTSGPSMPISLCMNLILAYTAYTKISVIFQQNTHRRVA